MSNPDKLVRMANQIAAFFRPYPEAEAVAGVSDHIRAFWTPAMRADLRSHLGRSDLDPLVLAAMRRQAMDLNKDPAAKAMMGPRELGELGSSDAG